MAAARATSARPSVMGFPVSCAMSWASSSVLDSRMSAAFERIAPRAEGSVAFQEGNAPAAASMAREVSPSPDFGVVPKVSEGFAGLTISETSPESAGTHSPPMKFFDSIWDSITVYTSLLVEEWLAPRPRLDLPRTPTPPNHQWL